MIKLKTLLTEMWQDSLHQHIGEIVGILEDNDMKIVKNSYKTDPNGLVIFAVYAKVHPASRPFIVKKLEEILRPYSYGKPTIGPSEHSADVFIAVFRYIGSVDDDQ